MLRAKSLAALIFLIALLGFGAFLPRTGKSAAILQRLTHTSEEIINLNPSLSGDGHQLVFESTANLGHTNSGPGFHAFRTDLESQTATFSEIAATRIVAPGISQDGSAIAFSSVNDLVGHNSDHNSEIFLQTDAGLRQVTNSHPDSLSSRVDNGSFQPSITDDGRFVAFTSNRDLVGSNADLNSEMFLFEVESGILIQVTDSNETGGVSDAKISGDGSKIVFTRENDGTSNLSRDLLLYDRATQTSKVIADHAPGLALTYGRAISDNGLRVVYSRELVEHQSQVVLFDAPNNTSRQITAFGTRVSEVPLNPTISGDGKRIAFATRRRVTAANDGGVELYLYDLPTAEFRQLTDAPSNATAEVVASLNDDGSLVAFNFPRVLSGEVSSNDMANNCEIYLAKVPPRPAFSPLIVLNGASMGKELALAAALPKGGIVVGIGGALAIQTQYGSRSQTGSFPFSLAGTSVTVNGVEAELLYVSPAEINFVIPNETIPGPADIVVTNSEGFQSRSSVSILNAAPGIFTSAGDGRGHGIVLDGDTLLAGPFDPTGDRLRLIVFTTGTRHASNISVTIAGRNAPVEAVLPSPDLPGLDEIHILVPAELRGGGEVNLIVEADRRQSNLVTFTLSGSSLRDIVINEILADPPDGLMGDANQDGTRSSADDEFVELINSTTHDLDLTGYEIQTRTVTSLTDVIRHRFSSPAIFPAGTAMVIFGGGNPNLSNPSFAGSKVFTASTGSLSLANTGGIVTLSDRSGAIVTFVTYGTGVGLPGDANQSLTRSPDITGSFILHKLAPAGEQRAFSPGTRVDGGPFSATPAISSITVMPISATLTLGQRQQFSAGALAENGEQLTDVIFDWQSSDSSVATVDSKGLATTVTAGTTMIVASARNARSSPSLISVLPLTPTPTPTPSPSSTPTPIPSPSPFPSATPSPSPSPSTRVVISQVYGGGGNSGAAFRNDFVEIFNSGSVPADLTGWSVQYASATASTWLVTSLTSVSLAPGQYYLIQQTSSGTTGQTLPAPDSTGTINLASTAGKIALVNSSIPLAGACPAGNGITDFVGYGSTANCAEGSAPTSAPSNTMSIQRSGNGCLDSQNNAGDFVRGTPNPRNTAHVFNFCTTAGLGVHGLENDLLSWLFGDYALNSQLATIRCPPDS